MDLPVGSGAFTVRALDQEVSVKGSLQVEVDAVTTCNVSPQATCLNIQVRLVVCYYFWCFKNKTNEKPGLLVCYKQDQKVNVFVAHTGNETGSTP